MSKKAHKKILDKVLKNFNLDKNSNQYSIWSTDAILAQDFYDGVQWTIAQKEKLEENGQPAIVINLIAPRIDAILGSELENRTKIGFRDRNFSPSSKLVSDGLTQLALNVQENADTQMEQSITFRDGLITGIGWLDIDVEEGYITTKSVTPFEVIWDKDDTSDQLTDSQRVSRVKYVDIAEAKLRFPNKSKEIDDLVAEGTTSSGQSEGILPLAAQSASFKENSSGSRFNFVDGKNSKILIVEQQYKEATVKYRFLDKGNNVKEVFSKDEADKKKLEGTDIEAINGVKIFRAFFTDGILFENMPLPIQTGNFTLVPFLYKRSSNTYAPYGLVKNAIDPQTEVNKRRSKQMHYLNTQGIIMDDDAVDNKENLAKEISKPNYVISKRRGSELVVQNNLQLSQGQAGVLADAKNDVSAVMGVFDDFIGATTNAQSGIAIGRKQIATQRGKASSFDHFSRFKKRMGRVLGNMIQSLMSTSERIQVFGGEGEIDGIEDLELNTPYEIDGETYFTNDITSLRYTVYVEQLPNFEAPPEQLAENLTNMIMNGQIQILLQSPTLAKSLGLPYIDKIIKEIGGAQPSSPTAQGVGGDTNQQSEPTNLPQITGR